MSDKGLIDCETLTRLMLERATTAREAIRIGGELIEKYGWCDVGEALTIADPNEVWLMEIVGPGQGRGRRRLGRPARARRPRLGRGQRGADRRDRSGRTPTSSWPRRTSSRSPRSTATGIPTSGEPFRFYEAYNPGRPHELRVDAAGMAGARPAGPVARAARQQQRLSVLGQAGEAGRARRRSWRCSATRTRAPTSTWSRTSP